MSLKLILGCMYSGKTTELLRLYKNGIEYKFVRNIS